MKKSTYIPLIVLNVILAFGSVCGQENNKNSSPNIIYILADDLGYGDVKAFNPEGFFAVPCQKCVHKTYPSS